ncbi:MAG: efflux RND transporter permease subunit [Synechococcaceae cyanobacterium SM2_3_2]|nr:efflux RND transporter permease subunit [Synechococcaceae cyanobacterium SM2_3_2]
MFALQDSDSFDQDPRPQDEQKTQSGIPAAGLSISGTAIRRHIGTLMLALAVLVMGFFFINRLPVALLPSITYPRIGVRIDTPGIAPEIAIDEITRPLEEALSTTEGVEQLYSSTREGQVRVDLYFAAGGDIDQALNETTAAVNRAWGRLPSELEAPVVFKFDPSNLPVFEFALTSASLGPTELRTLADEDLSRELGVVPGVASVDVAGGNPPEVQVNLDLTRMQALGLGLTSVLTQLQERNQDVSGGWLQGGTVEALTRTVGRIRDVEELRNLRFTSDSGSQVLLTEFAQLQDQAAPQQVQVSLNGSPAIKLSIQKQPEANTIAVVDGIRRRLEQLSQTGLLPEDAVITATTDESRFIRSSIQNVALSGLSGAVLAGIAVLLFLGSLRQTFIVVVAIPLASLMAVILMGLFGLSINIISLGGLALGVGIVVDNAIVMLENIATGTAGIPRDQGSPRQYAEQILDQSERSSRELESALLASTATNLVSVLPFLLIGGFISLIFNELILTISFAVAGSLVVGLTVVPMLTSRLLTIRRSSGISRLWILQRFNWGVRSGTFAYQSLLAKLLRRPILVLLTALLFLGGSSVWMVGQLNQELLPRISTGQVRFFGSFPLGTTFSQNHRAMAAVDQIIQAQPETEYAFTIAGGSAFGGNLSENPRRGTSEITLVPGTHVGEYVDRVNQQLGSLNLVDTRLRVSPGSVRGLNARNSAVNADVDVVLQGNDAEALTRAGEQVLAALDERGSLARYRPDGDESQAEVRIVPDWQRAGPLGLTPQSIGRVVSTALQGSTATQLQQGNQLIDVRVQLAEGSITQPSQLLQVPLFVQNGQPVRLGDVARLEEGLAPSEIPRINQRQVYIIVGDRLDGVSQNAAIAEANQIVASLELPAGVTVLPSGAAESNQELRHSLVLLGSLAAFLVFVVMAVQYNSLIDPLVIMLTVPLALSGGIAGLFFTNTAVGATVLVGAVLLVGIVVNNAILLVELANQIRTEQGLTYKQAMLLAAPQRLRPILMTTVTTVLGLFPLALGIGEGSELLQPLGVVVFSGLSLATLLTLFVIPSVYVLLHGLLSRDPGDDDGLSAGSERGTPADSGQLLLQGSSLNTKSLPANAEPQATS